MDIAKRTSFGAIIVSTRELVSHIDEQATKLCNGSKYICFKLYGEINSATLREDIDKGADIFVTTPERFYEVIDKGYLKIDNLRYAIFEEFDRLLSDLDIEKTIDILNQIRSFSLNSRKNLIICKELSTELQKNFERIRRKNLFITRNNKKNVFGRNILHTIV
uniref:Helicase ATP-binding domain-containing protein n=1 Tax=Strongyloides papillosus TaxID=174720 RepID=A0A0N5BCX3_STREA